MNLHDHTLALIAGGWHSEDREEIKKEYHYTEKEIEEVTTYIKGEENESYNN